MLSTESSMNFIWLWRFFPQRCVNGRYVISVFGCETVPIIRGDYSNVSVLSILLLWRIALVILSAVPAACHLNHDRAGHCSNDVNNVSG